MSSSNRWFLFAVIATLLAVPAIAQQTVGLFQNDDASERGYTLFPTTNNAPPHATYLLNNDGLVVNSWGDDFVPGLMAYLRPNGNLIKSALDPFADPVWTTARGKGGLVYEYDWDGNLVWEYSLSTDLQILHHDMEILPNGNIIMILWEWVSFADAVAIGRDPATMTTDLWPLAIVEVEPTPPIGGNIVWEWHSLGHIVQDFDITKLNYGVVADHPELINLNFINEVGADWIHANGLDYNADRDEIIVSSRAFSEVWVIDHSTTTNEAATHSGGNSGKGGDLLYRYGNPQAYDRGTEADRKLFFQHDIQWIEPGLPGAGNLLVYNNGENRATGNYSSVDEFAPSIEPDGSYTEPVAGQPYGPASLIWTYEGTPQTDFYSRIISGTERMPNGNTMIIEGTSGHIFEVQNDGTKVWDYRNPISSDVGTIPQETAVGTNRVNVFKARRYLPDFPGLLGQDLSPGDPIETHEKPLPIPAGSLRATGGSNGEIQINWDAASCTSNDYNVIYGNLDQVSNLAVIGAECGVGITGGFSWTNPPAQNLYFLVVGTDASGIYESSWGLNTGGQRFLSKASFTCGTTTKIVTNTCP